MIENALYAGDAACQDEKVQQAFQTLVTLNESVTGGVARIDRIVTALRNFARLDEGEYQSFDVNRGIEDTLTLVLADPEVRVEVEKDLGLLQELYCRPRELNQVFINILNNALEATENQGRITIKTREDEEWGPDWGWPSAIALSKTTAGPSAWKASPERGPPSSLCSP